MTWNSLVEMQKCHIVLKKRDQYIHFLEMFLRYLHKVHREMFFNSPKWHEMFFGVSNNNIGNDIPLFWQLYPIEIIE